jgi:site-specific recombinase XerD
LVEVGQPGVGLRDTCASLLIAHGASFKAVQAQLGQWMT